MGIVIIVRFCVGNVPTFLWSVFDHLLILVSSWPWMVNCVGVIMFNCVIHEIGADRLISHFLKIDCDHFMEVYEEDCGDLCVPVYFFCYFFFIQ